MSKQMDGQSVKLLQHLGEASSPKLVADLAETLQMNQAQVAAITTAFESENLCSIIEESFEELHLLEDGTSFCQSNQPLIEKRIAALLKEANKPLSTPEIAEALSESAQNVGKSLRLVIQKGYANKDGKALVWKDSNLEEKTPDEALLERCFQAGGSLNLTAEESQQKETKNALKSLKSRGYIKFKTRKNRFVVITDHGQQVLRDGVEEIVQVNQLSESLLLSGDWKKAQFRPYDINLDVRPVHGGKPHPLRRVLEETRRAFLNMGFTEIRGNYVESAFWDFDALFQPQDHPAREMQDTFYCSRPEKFSLPEKEIVETIRETHETGGTTGSSGWQYKWSDEKAQQVVLRTHTTAVTVERCYENPNPPQKVFCVGRVFRRETIDYKHLPEFHQVDGIIVEENASFANLLGTLKQFYHQMGFDEVKYRPAFFPYTEPSVEVFVRMPGKKEWFELGGAGVFRPEVTKPAGVNVPVLAWGLGLERLAMIRYQIHDIRQLYLSELNWLKKVGLCQ